MSLSSASRQAIRCAAKRQCRSFSTTPTLGAAAEVKKLGVIGAGQMVYTISRELRASINCSRVSG
jgi:3-hydroxybutyryl-CoA dehydrogenase